MKKKIGFIGLIFILFLQNGAVCAKGALNLQESCVTTVKIQGIEDANATDSEEMYLGELSSLIDMEELDQSLENMSETEDITFSDLFNQLLTSGWEEIDFGTVLDAGKNLLFQEITENKNLLIEILFLVFAFSVLSNFAGVFDKSYISEICFILVYCVLAVLLLESVTIVSDIVVAALDNCISFMKALVPTFCFAMIFSSNANSSVGFYQLSFLIIYIVEWVFENFLIPGVHVYILMELLSNFFEEEKFKGLTELMKSFIGWIIKISWAVILGINVIQNLIAPAKDRLTGGTLGKVASAIPGIGNSINSVGELLIGSGMVIKNCVGVAALILLAVICVVPLLKVYCMVILYKVAAAAVGPVADKRIYGCMEGIADGSILYAKTLGTCLLLFIVTIALTTAATSFVY